MHLYAIRHGQSFVNLPDWDGINPDLPLTPTGEKQAQALAAWLPTYAPHIDAIYCSSLRRPRGTAGPLAAAYGLELQVDHRLREIGNNRIDHTPYPEDGIPGRDDWAEAAWERQRPFASLTKSAGGESLMHVRIRVASFIEDIVERHPDQHVIAVCHGGVTGAIFDYCFGVGPWRRCDVYTFNTGISHFEYRETSNHGPWHLYAHNLVEHLRVAGCEMT